jgi:hypothetical protein
MPYGVDLERFRPPRGRGRAGPVRLLFVGHLSQRKGSATCSRRRSACAACPGSAEHVLVGRKAVPRPRFAPYAICSAT